MALLTDSKFSFASKATPEDAWAVVRFSGEEGLGDLYRFEIDLVSDCPDIDPDRILEAPASLTIHRPEGDLPFHGILSGFEMRQAYEEYVFYRAVLVPRFWWLSQTFHNQVFLDTGLPGLLTAVLKDGGLTDGDFELRLEKDYPVREYVCQYRESHFDFISRWMERDGLYYYFEQTDDKEKLMVTDTGLAHTAMPQGGTLRYSPPSGLDGGHLEEVIDEFFCRQRLMPREVRIKDYNYRRPSLAVTGRAKVADRGRGAVYFYGDHIGTPEEGAHLAGVRAEELLCRQREFIGQSRVPFLRPGYTFRLQDHYRGDFNREYLTVRVEHQGCQTACLTAGLGDTLEGFENQLFYRNDFSAIQSDRQYRPRLKAEKARFYGIMNAVIDGAGSGQHAELDEMGRYKVVLPFDRSGRKDGKASAWVRMMQPYGGTDHGMHFPLHKGTEVLLMFIDGDPDRPIIAGAAPNPENPSLLSSDNQTMGQITTAGGNKIHFEDREGSQRILMHTPTAGSFVRIGAHNDPSGDADPKFGVDKWKFSAPKLDKDGINLTSAQGLDIRFATSNSFVAGESTSATGGVDIRMVFGEAFAWNAAVQTSLAAGLHFDVNAGWNWTLRNSVQEMCWFRKKVKGETITIEAAKELVQREVTRLEGDVTDVVGEADQAIGQLGEAIGEATRVRGKLTEAIGTAREAKGELETVTGTANRLVGELNTAVDSAYQVRGELNQLIGKADMAAFRIKRAAGTINTVSREVNRIHSLDQTV